MKKRILTFFSTFLVINLMLIPMTVKADVSLDYKQGNDTGASKLPVIVSKVDTINQSTIKGVDLTSYQAQIAAKVNYYDFKGQPLNGMGLMNLLKENGVNHINLKVAVNPFDEQGRTYGQGQPTLENAIKTATLAQNAGLKINFTLLYSDAYTSDENQKAPKNWPTDVENLNIQVKSYTDSVLDKLSENQLSPSMITVGNQINYQFIDKKAWSDWTPVTQLLKTATDSIKEKMPDTQIGIGLGKPNSYWDSVIWQLNNAEIKYDQILANVNPAWNTLSDIEAAKKATTDAGKKFTVGTVTYPFTDQDSDGKQNDTLSSDILAKEIGAISPQGQGTYIQKLFSLVTAGDNNDSAGVFYGDATWIAVKAGSEVNFQYNKDASNIFGTGWASQYSANYIDGADQYWGGNTQDNQALFDSLGKPLQTLKVFNQISDADNNAETPTDDPNAAQKDPYEFGGETGLKEQSVTINQIPSMTEQSIRGVDISSYQALKDANVKFYDYDGNEASLMKVLADQGVNYIRLRIWNDPKSTDGRSYGGGNNDVEQSLKIAKEAKEYGMKILLDFQYSDFWADPGAQIAPKAWKNKTQEQLEESVYTFTQNTIKTFQDNGVDVGMVQIGNEITQGMISVTSSSKPVGSVWTVKEKADKIAGFLAAGAKATRDSSSNILITIHLESLSMGTFNTVMSMLKNYNVDYDVMGASYYPFWGVNKNTLSSVQDMVNDKYGKLFAIMETAWINADRDGDGTANSVNTTGNAPYPIGSQGQVDMLTDMYSTITSKTNGLGGFYWEPAWIPVRAGWINKAENDAASEKYGSGWASSASSSTLGDGYYADSKLFYNGKGTWGGSSWDNQALFDILGKPLQSLKFYKNAGNSNKEQLTRLEFIDSSNNVVKTIFSKIAVGETVNIKFPKIDGWITESGATSYNEKATKTDLKTVKIKMKEAAPQGPYITYGKYITVTAANYNTWSNFNWKEKLSAKEVTRKTYLAKGKYNHKNGQTYLSLYNEKGVWQGYINAKATKVGSGKQGTFISDGRKVIVTKKGYNSWQNFSWKKKQVTDKLVGKEFTARGYYQHINGSTYYSVFDSKDRWQGYINANAVKVATKKQGNYIPFGRQVIVIKKNYNTWQNFNWKKKYFTDKLIGKEYTARGFYNHENGSTYYSIFDKNGVWQGYLNSKAAKLK